MENFIGELAALGAALSFSLASTTYTLAGRKLGASISMALSLVVSLLFLLPLHQALMGEVVPHSASLSRWLLLGSSSLAGFVVSALFLLRSFQYIGPRLTMLIGSSSPVFAALMAWIILGQGLPTYAVAGIALVLSGVFVVLSGDSKGVFSQSQADYGKGVLMAFAAAIMQGASFVLMSEGVADNYPALSASLMRTVVGLVVLLALISARGKLRHNFTLISSEPRSLLMVMLAALSGPVIGTTLILVSLQFTSVGISSTLTGTTPILMIPISFLVFGERVTKRGLIGTLVAIAGVALLFAL